jgi:hypothetical protein
VTFQSEGVAFATVMPNLVTLPIPKTRINYFVAVSTTLAGPNASDAVQDSSRKLGSSPKRTILSPANVRHPNTSTFIISFSLHLFLDFSLQLLWPYRRVSIQSRYRSSWSFVGH